MADTIAVTKNGVWGDMRVIAGVLTAGGGAVATGMDYVYDCQITRLASHNSGGEKTIAINAAASGVGDIVVNSATTGDDFQVLIIGR